MSLLLYILPFLFDFGMFDLHYWFLLFSHPYLVLFDLYLVPFLMMSVVSFLSFWCLLMSPIFTLMAYWTETLIFLPYCHSVLLYCLLSLLCNQASFYLKLQLLLAILAYLFLQIFLAIFLLLQEEALCHALSSILNLWGSLNYFDSLSRSINS